MKQFNYSKVKYKNHTTKITIICSTHGEFEQKAGNHLRGYGCIKCGGIYSPSTDEWIEKVKEKHGNVLKALKLAKNFGQHNATYCGIKNEYKH
jgi:hypothetical protein